ncbi:MAG: hypothetical protein ACK5P3_01805, partial [Dolichospermum sp.]
HRPEGAMILNTSLEHATSGLIVPPCPFKVSQCPMATITKFLTQSRPKSDALSLPKWTGLVFQIFGQCFKSLLELATLFLLP